MTIGIRHATRNDALHVAAIVDIAGHGIDLDSWIRDSGGDAVLDAARRATSVDPRSPYHFSKAWLVEVDGDIAGGLVGDMVAEDEEYMGDLPPAVVPLATLETRLTGYWSILAVAVYPEFRGGRLAEALLRHAGALAAQRQAKGLSLVVEDANAKAMSIYRRLGFTETERLPWIAYGGREGPGDWVLMKRDL